MRSVHLNFKSFVLGSILSLLIACTGIEGEASMQVWLDAPLDGSTFQVGETVQLHTHARDVNGPGLDEFHYFANDRLLAIGEADSTLPLVHSFMGWNPTETGTYDVYTRAVSISGATAESVHIKVTITEQQFKEMGQGPDASSTPTITRPPITPTRTTTQKIPTLTPSPTRTFNPTNTVTQRPPAVYLYASTTSITPGQPVTLSWDTVNTNNVTLNDLPVSNYSGSTTVRPETTIVYTLIGYYPGGSISDSVTITVKNELPPVPLPRVSSYVTLTETTGSGTGGYYHVGDRVEICYSFAPASYLFEFRDYYNATIGSGGAEGPYDVVDSGGMYSGEESTCWAFNLYTYGNFHAYQFRVKGPSEMINPPPVDFAEIWIYVLP